MKRETISTIVSGLLLGVVLSRLNVWPFNSLLFWLCALVIVVVAFFA